MNFNKLYSESGFIRDLAFKKLFLETPELLTFVYEYCLQLLSLPFDDTIDLLDSNVNDNINIKKLIDSITGEVRNGQIAIVDFNLDYYDEMTYNEIDSLPDADPKKIFYLLTSKNNDKYYGLYKNSELGKMLVRRMEMMIENFDAIFYYDKDKFNEKVAKEVGFEEGKIEGKKEIISKMLNAGVSDSDIIKYSSVTESELDNIKKSIGK